MSENFVWIKNSTCEQIGREVLTNWFLNENVPKSEKNRIIYEDKDGDTFGNSDVSQPVHPCQDIAEKYPGWVEDNTDCDDTNPDVHEC